MRRRPANRALLALTAGCLAAAGCGSTTSDTTSHPAASTTTATQSSAHANTTKLVATIEAICARNNQTLAATEPTIRSESQAKHAAQSHARIEQATLSELNKLTIPPAMESDWKEFITSRQAMIQALLTVAKSGLEDGNGVLQPVIKAQARLLTAAKHSHLKTCAQES
jgi:hypothetical protein